ncbi:MAG: AhpC/TSA family protein [Planctomycetaceae bacterium]|nr:AhpC/TSA family protein [Planctomycetaceae bacterium]
MLLTPRCLCAVLLPLVLCGLFAATECAAADDDLPGPAVGDVAPDFSLKLLGGEAINLSDLTKESPVVLLVLRGYPGYQCPLCTKQVGRFIAAGEKLKDAGAQVVLVYPGPAEGLDKHAAEFVTGQTWPDNFHFVVDPDYTFTLAWTLRWDEPMETSYPSTFVIGQDRKIRFAKVSQTHGGRASVDEVLEALKQ